MATSPRAQVILDGDVGPLRQKLREATAGINTFGRDSAGALSEALGPAQALQLRLGAIATVITSGAFAAFVRTSINVQDEMSKSAQKAGVSTEAFSGMAYAAGLADVQADQLGKTYSKLNALLSDGQQGQKEAVETFRRLKLDPENFKDADALLLALSDRFADMPDGVEKVGLAIDVFGEKLGPGLIPFLNGGRAGLEELREEAKRLGVVVDTQTGKAAEEFNDTLTRVKTRAEGVGMQFAKALLPALQAVAGEFTNVEKSGGAVDTMAAGLRIGMETLAVLAAKVAFVFAGTGREIGALMAQVGLLWDVLRAPPGEIIATAKRNWAGFTAISDAVKADAAAARAKLEDFERRVMGLAPPARDPEERDAELKDPPDKRRRKGKPGPAAPKEVAETDRSVLAFYELVLSEEKRNAVELDKGAEYGKQRELDFWRNVLATAQLGTADRMSVLRKAANLELEIASKSAQDRKALDAEMLAQAEQQALGRVDGQRAAARAAFELGHITKQRHLQLDAQYEEQRYEIQRAALERRLQLLAADPTSSEVEKQRLVGRLLQLEQQYQQGMLQLQTAMAKEGMGGETFAAIGQTFTSALGSMLTAGRSWQSAMGSIFTGLRDIFLAELVTKPLAAYIATQAKMLAVKMGFLAAEKTVTTAGSAVTVGVKAAETVAVGGLNATQAGTGAFAALAAIPVIGPALAAVAGPAMFATVMAMVSRGMAGGKSAAGGYDIPSGINPMTQLHQEEMVLPAHIANPLRGALADGGLGGAGGGRPAGDVIFNLRGASAGDFFMVHKTDLVKALKAARRDQVF